MRNIAIPLACLASIACAPAHRLREPRASHSASLLADGTILVAGGFRKGPDGVSQLYTATTELVDAAGGGAVRAGPPLHDARAGHIAVTLRDGRILLAGGWAFAGDTVGDLPTASAEVFVPEVVDRIFADGFDAGTP